MWLVRPIGFPFEGYEGLRKKILHADAGVGALATQELSHVGVESVITPTKSFQIRSNSSPSSDILSGNGKDHISGVLGC